MKAASLKEIKTELGLLHPDKLIEVCLQLTKFKKENKELLSYLLFEAGDEQSYINDVKLLIDDSFTAINTSNQYLAKKTIRKALRTANKYIKYSGSKQTEVEILIHFCKACKKSDLKFSANTVLGNIYQRQLIRIKKALSTLHEDLQFDYAAELKDVE
jgi:hypothetical protein